MVALLLAACLFLGASASGQTSGPNADQALARNLDEFLRSRSPYGFSGAVLVARHGEVLLRRGYGKTDPGSGAPVTADTIFDIGSITKQFTAAAILKLEMEGRLSTDDRLSEHLVGVPPDKQEVRLRHLLTHSSGAPGSLGRDFQPISRDAFVQLALSSPWPGDPGRQFAYSNVGYSLLAAVVETSSGQAWQDFVAERLLDPAGLRATGYSHSSWTEMQVARLSGERVSYPDPRDRPEPSWHLLGNGGLLSTVEDLYRWQRALESETILSREAKTKLFSPHVPWTGRKDVSYGFGWEIAKTPRGTRVIRHSGGSIEGVNGVVQRFVDDDLIIILLSNRFLDNGQPAIFSLPAALERRVLGPLRVLFVGNSQTSWNDVPVLVEGLAAAAGGLQLDAEASTRGGETLMGHTERTDDDAPLEKITKGGWDFVVLQEHGGHLASGGDSTFTAASRLVRAAREAGARPILYSTWARKSKPETQARITNTNRLIGERLQVTVAPAGQAFRRLRAGHPEIELYREDEIHGNLAGGYLAANVLFSTLFGISPEGLPADSGNRDALAPDVVRILRSEAWATVSAFR